MAATKPVAVHILGQFKFPCAPSLSSPPPPSPPPPSRTPSPADSDELQTKDVAAGGDPEPAAPPARRQTNGGAARERPMRARLRSLAMRVDMQRNKELDYDRGREHSEDGASRRPITARGRRWPDRPPRPAALARAARTGADGAGGALGRAAGTRRDRRGGVSSRPLPHYMKSTANFDATDTSKGAIISTVQSLRKLAADPPASARSLRPSRMARPGRSVTTRSARARALGRWRQR
jgi:hypothetical protein